MAVAIEIRRTSQPPTGRKCRTEHAANKNVIVQIPDCCLTRRRIADHKVRMAVAVKVDYCSYWRRVWLESNSYTIASGGKGGSHSARSKLKNTAAEPI